VFLTKVEIFVQVSESLLVLVPAEVEGDVAYYTSLDYLHEVSSNTIQVYAKQSYIYTVALI